MTTIVQDGVGASLESNYAPFINGVYGVIGRTVSTKFEPNTSSRFYFWVAARDEAVYRIEIGNIIAAVADDRSDITFGMVAEMRSYSDVDSFLADYLSHNFGDAEIVVPTDISEVIVVTCNVMRNMSSTTRPVGRSRAYFPSRQGIQFAYGVVDQWGASLFSGAPIPIGIFQNGDGTIAPISIDEDFLIGPEGAHLNVSGISGLASKTSAIEFVLRALLDFTQKKIGVVMFNVKSRDLLYIDQANPKISADQWSLDAYSALGMSPKPFTGARFFAPSNPRKPGCAQTLRQLQTEIFHWDLQMLYLDIPSLFNQLDWDDKMEGVWFAIQEEIEAKKLLTYSQMVVWVQRQIDTAFAGNKQWIRGNHIATWSKMQSHLKRFPLAYSGLIQSMGTGKDIPWAELESGGVFVIDMQALDDRGKKLVFGRSIRDLSRLLEERETFLDAIVVFVDELNKFAPSGSIRTPLKSRLVDITARGRSIGLVLVGAEQFASDVEKEVIENCSTYLFGRTEANELRAPNYSSFSDEVKTKLSMLPQGQLLAKFAKFSQPIFVRFPYPPVMPGDQYDASGYEQGE
jgi:uncharacterized protein